jgi:hypothetical protein
MLQAFLTNEPPFLDLDSIRRGISEGTTARAREGEDDLRRRSGSYVSDVSDSDSDVEQQGEEAAAAAAPEEGEEEEVRRCKLNR